MPGESLKKKNSYYELKFFIFLARNLFGYSMSKVNPYFIIDLNPRHIKEITCKKN